MTFPIAGTMYFAPVTGSVASWDIYTAIGFRLLGEPRRPAAARRDGHRADRRAARPGVLAQVRAVHANICSCPSGASILHADLDAFYASVEQRDDPRLRGRPVIVGGGRRAGGELRGQGRGVRTAMGGRQAARLCPDAVVVPPRMSGVRRGQQGGVRGVRRHDAAGRGDLDRRGVPRRRRAAAHRRDARSTSPRGCAREVREQVGLPITVGVARTKFLAKVASAVAKPDGLLVVPPGGELDVPAPAAGRAAVGRRPVTAAKLHAARHHTVGEVAALERGGAGRPCSAGHRAATCTRWRTTATRGRCRSVAGAARSARSAPLGRGPHAAERRRRGRSPGSSTGSTRRLRAADRVGRTVVLRLRFDDFSRVDPVAHPAAADVRTRRRSSTTAHGLLAAGEALIGDRGLTLIGIAVANLDDDGAVQLELPLRAHTGGELDAAMEVRDRFGSAALTRASLLGRQQGPTTPLLPD